MRGQNRTAPQSFHQSWSNVTNAALKKNCEKKLPVRVIRGPKLCGKHGTKASGGGYRYDGLYIVVKAEMRVCGGGSGTKKRKEKKDGAGLRTAMFTLKRKTK